MIPLPTVIPWKVVAAIGAVLLVVASYWKVYTMGEASERKDWEVKMAEATAQIAVLEARAPIITTKIVKEYVDVIKYRDRIKIQEVTKFVTPVDDQACKINEGFVRAINDAADTVLLDTPKTTASAPAPTASDRLDSGKKLSEAADVISKNYSTYNKIALQLESLQKWIRDQKAEWEKAK